MRPVRGLYAITDDASETPHVRQIEDLVRAGAPVIQLRAKHACARELFEMTVAALAVTRPAGVPLIVNDRVDVALAAGADGVHVGQDDLPADVARMLLGPDAIVGVSTHSVEQARRAAGQDVDYVAIGPAFPTSTKANPDAVVGIEGLRAVRAVVPQTLVAIGGISIDLAAAVFEAGADAVAVIGDLRTAPSLEERVRAYQSLSGGPRP